jgi:predicted nucleic acid-binding protein
MSDADRSYLFDVGVIALAHTAAPVRDSALSYVRDAITGDIDAVVPYPALFGAHTILTTYYGHSNEDASRLLQNFMDAKQIHWYDGMPEDVVRSGFSQASEANVGGWDGYYAQVAIDQKVDTVLTIDDDFERFDTFETEVILSADEFSELNRFLGN